MRWRSWVDKRIGFGLYQTCVSSVSIGRLFGFGLRSCRWGVGMSLGPGSGRVGWCYVCVHCVYCRSRYLCIVLGWYLRIWGAPSVQSCYTLSISTFYRVFVCGRYHKSRLVCVLSDMVIGKSGPQCWGRGFDTICTTVCHDCSDSSTTCRMCRLELVKVYDLGLSKRSNLCFSDKAIIWIIGLWSMLFILG